MAVWNEIGIGRWNRFIQKLCDMKGGPPARQLSSEIQFGHAIQTGVENRYLEQWFRFGFNGNSAAVAANISAHQLRNPAGSNVVAVMEKIAIVPQAAAGLVSVSLGPITTDLASVLALTATRFDPRGQQAPTLVYSQQNTTVSLVTLGNVFGACSENQQANVELIFYDDQQITVLPGDGLRLQNNTVNQALTVMLWWRERFLEPGERF